jgi:glycine cleavage system transcriptional repressor
MSTSRFIIHASGIDRVGMVSDISGQVIQNGGNVADSAASKLGQYFSLMMLVDLPDHKTDDLKRSLSAMPDISAAVFEAKETSDFVPRVACAYKTAGEVDPAHDHLFSHPLLSASALVCFLIDSGYFTLEGADNPGIVHTLTSALAAHGLSIERMETDQESAPMGGTTLFRMRGVCHAFEPLPKSFDAHAIRAELEALGDSLNCEVTMEDYHDDASSGAFFVG